MSVSKLYNSMVIPLQEGDVEEAREKYNNIVIRNSVLQGIIPHKLKNMSDHCKVICGWECSIYSTSMYSSLVSWIYCHLKTF